MKRNSVILSLAVAAATLAGCSSYHAAYTEPNNSAYPNNPNNVQNTGLSSNTSNETNAQYSQAPENGASYAQNTGNGYSNPSSSRYPPRAASNLNNNSSPENMNRTPNGNNSNYSPYGPTSPAGSNTGVNAASASPSDNSVAPLNTGMTPQGGSQTGGVTNANGTTSSVGPGQTNQMSSNTVATPVPAPAINNNANERPGSANEMNEAANGASAPNGNSSANAEAPAASPQLGGLNEKQTASQSMTDADVRFIKDAHGGNAFEIAAGQKALANSKDANVKNIGQRIIDDHTKADEQVTALANRNGDHDLGGMTADQLKDLSQLDKAKGADFDATYLRQQKTAHEQTIAEFKKEAQTADSRELRDWAAATVPTLQEHLDMINAQLNPTIGSER